MKFNNRENPVHKIGDKTFWESRSVAVNLVVLLKNTSDLEFRVLVSKRGPNAADFQGYYNLVAGYLDWDETGKEAAMRETWEECGLDLQKIMDKNTIFKDHLNHPWHVQTDPSSNRQNVSLRYAVIILSSNRDWPKLSIEHNEVLGEVEDPRWMKISKIKKHKWAFGHDKVIKEYLNFVNS